MRKKNQRNGGIGQRPCTVGCRKKFQDSLPTGCLWLTIAGRRGGGTPEMLTVPLNSSVRRHSLSTTYDTGPSRRLKGGVGPYAGGEGDSFAGRDVSANRTR